MGQIEVDWLPVFVAAVANMMIGFVWYSDCLFGSLWIQLNRFEQKKRSVLSILLASIDSLIIAYFIGVFQFVAAITTVLDGMFLGVCLWLGFVVTTQISSVIWGNTPFRLFLIDTGYKLLSFVVMAGIISA